MNRFTYEISRPKKPFLLPKVLREDAVVRLLAAAENTKHKLLLSICYGMGLRVSEVCALNIVDIEKTGGSLLHEHQQHSGFSFSRRLII